MNPLHPNDALTEAVYQVWQASKLSTITEGQRVLLETAFQCLMRARHWHDEHPECVASVASPSNGHN